MRFASTRCNLARTQGSFARTHRRSARTPMEGIADLLKDTNFE